MRNARTAAAVAAVCLGIAASAPSGYASRFDLAESRQDRARIRKIERLYRNLIFPIPILILSGRVSMDNIFDHSVRGRVTPVGQFDHSEAVNEYFFALASTPQSRVTKTTFQSLLAAGDKVAVEVDVHIKGTAGGPSFILRQTGFFTFNEENKVTSFDLAILNLGAAVNPKSEAEQEANIETVCRALTEGIGRAPATCPSEYDGFDDCVAFMHSIPYGTWDRANSDTVVCRQLHTLLTPYRPDVHCPHAGKTGGGMCVDMPYESFFETEF